MITFTYKGFTSLLIMSIVCCLCVPGLNYDYMKCYACTHHRTPDSCLRYTHRCSKDQYCVVTLSTDGIYHAGCASMSKCQEGVLQLIQYGHLVNQMCCNTPNCNKDLLYEIQTPKPLGYETSTRKTSHGLPITQDMKTSHGLHITHDMKTSHATHITQATRTSKLTSTSYPDLVLTAGLTCHVCSGPNCGFVSSQGSIIKCPDNFPYCMNVVQNSKDGDKLVTKRCASYAECKRDIDAVDASVHRAICRAYDPSEIYIHDFQCPYCCETSFCNKHIVPPSYSRINGSRK